MYGLGYQPPRIIGALARATSFNEVQALPVNADGSPTLFLMENEPSMYLVSLQNGQKSIQGYKMTPMPTAQEATENRLNSLEAALMDIKTMLEGKMANESNPASSQQQQSANV